MYQFNSDCGICGKKKFYVAKRQIILPTGDVATSQKYICGRCYSTLKGMLKSNHG